MQKGCFSRVEKTPPQVMGMLMLCLNKIWWITGGFPRPENQTQMTCDRCSFFSQSIPTWWWWSFIPWLKVTKSHQTINPSIPHIPSPKFNWNSWICQQFVFLHVEKSSIHSCWSGFKFANLKKQVQVKLDKFYAPNTCQTHMIQFEHFPQTFPKCWHEDFILNW